MRIPCSVEVRNESLALSLLREPLTASLDYHYARAATETVSGLYYQEADVIRCRVGDTVRPGGSGV